jgi:hypothetical protein
MMQVVKERHSVEVLRECIDLQNRKANDYQNERSTVKQADYYPSGIVTLLDIMHAKQLRMRSMVEAYQNDPNYKPSFEGIEDSLKDLINYASFAVSYLRYRMDGQDSKRDVFNRPQSNQDYLQNSWIQHPGSYQQPQTVSSEAVPVTSIYIQKHPADRDRDGPNFTPTDYTMNVDDHQDEKRDWGLPEPEPVYLAEKKSMHGESWLDYC